MTCLVILTDRRQNPELSALENNNYPPIMSYWVRETYHKQQSALYRTFQGPIKVDNDIVLKCNRQ